MLDPQLVAALQKQQEITQALGPPSDGVISERQHFSQARLWWNEGGPEMAEVRELVIPGTVRETSATVYVPTLQTLLRPAYVYLHGGGYRLGSPRSNDRQLRELAAAWGGIVVSLDYPHLPEQGFPGAVEATAAAYQWLSEWGPDWGIDGQRLACGGSSAGANVAMGAAVAVGGTGCGYMKAAACIVGVFDDALDTSSMSQYGDGPPPNRNSARAMFEAYAKPEQRDDPRFNLLLADPALFPPMFLAAAQCDVYRDSSLRFAGHVAQAGVQPQLRTYAGMSHLFFGYSRMVDKARECISDVAQFLQSELPA